MCNRRVANVPSQNPVHKARARKEGDAMQLNEKRKRIGLGEGKGRLQNRDMQAHIVHRIGIQHRRNHIYDRKFYDSIVDLLVNFWQF